MTDYKYLKINIITVDKNLPKMPLHETESDISRP